MGYDEDQLWKQRIRETLFLEKKDFFMGKSDKIQMAMLKILIYLKGFYKKKGDPIRSYPKLSSCKFCIKFQFGQWYLLVNCKENCKHNSKLNYNSVC